LSEFDDSWQDMPRTPSVDRWFSRAIERGASRPELTRSDYLPAKQMTAEEFAAFQAKGGKIDYGAARMDKQILNHIRHEDRVRRHPLFDIVVDVVAAWDCSDYLAKHRRVARDILALPRNDRRRKLEGLSTMARRHQRTLRLVHALASDGINTADYCRRHKLDKADASRMLAHLYKKEPGLVDAIGAISACGTVTSWQNRQRKRKFPKRERGLEIVYGFNYRDVADDGWLSDVPSTQFRSVVSGRFKPIAPKPYEPWPEPFRAFDLHQPDTWCKLGFPAVVWDSFRFKLQLHRLPSGTFGFTWERAVERYDVPLRYGVFDRYREISRKVRLKNGKSATWKPIGRAIPICDWDIRPLGYCPQGWHRLPDVWIGWDPTQARYETLAIVSNSYPGDYRHSRTVSGRRKLPGKVIFVRIERWIHEAKWEKRPMCNPVHSGQVLVAAKRGILPDVELRWALYCRAVPARRADWIKLPPIRKPHGLLPPFTHCN
jgi:hypothetical protein